MQLRSPNVRPAGRQSRPRSSRSTEPYLYVWEFHFDPKTNIVETHISRLRAKVDRGQGAELIQTVRGSGYILPRAAFSLRSSGRSRRWTGSWTPSPRCVYGAVAILMGRAYPAHARRYHLGAAVLVLLIGMSRVYLGVHWFTDVLAGLAAGLFVLIAGANILRAGGSDRRRRVEIAQASGRKPNRFVSAGGQP